MNNLHEVYTEYLKLRAERGEEVSQMLLEYCEEPCHLDQSSCTCSVRTFSGWKLHFGGDLRPFRLGTETEALNLLTQSCETLRYLIDADKERARRKARRGY